jgi:hypothetical protein
MDRFWTKPSFWESVAASLVAAGIWYFGGRFMAPLWEFVSVNFWAGIGEWIHEAGWLAFWVTVALWFVNRRARGVAGTTGKTTMIGSLATPPPLRIVSSGVGLVIESAKYGTGPENEVDVTQAVQNLMQGTCIDALVTNEAMGGDPVVGIHKRLRVVYAVNNGPRREATASEKTRLKIP